VQAPISQQKKNKTKDHRPKKKTNKKEEYNAKPRKQHSLKKSKSITETK